MTVRPRIRFGLLLAVVLLALLATSAVSVSADDDDDDDGEIIIFKPTPAPLGVGSVGSQIPHVQRPDPLATACNLLDWGLANNNQQAIDMALVGIIGFGPGTVADALAICADVG